MPYWLQCLLIVAYVMALLGAMLGLAVTLWDAWLHDWLAGPRRWWLDWQTRRRMNTEVMVKEYRRVFERSI